MAVKVNGCVFVKVWACPVDGDEVPLEVCRLCVEARKTRDAFTTVFRGTRQTEEVLRAPTPRPPSEPVVSPPPLIQEEKRFPPIPVKEALREGFSELDRQFENDEISLEEYLNKRRSIIEAASDDKKYASAVERQEKP